MDKKLVTLKENVEKAYDEFITEFEKAIISLMQNNNVNFIEKEDKYETLNASFISSFDDSHGGEIYVKKVIIENGQLYIVYRPYDCELCKSTLQNLVKDECYGVKLDTFFEALYNEIEKILLN